MKKLHLLVLRTFIGPFFLIFFIVVFILLMQFLWRYIDEMVGKGLQVNVIAELLLYTSASLVPMALPLAILMSSLMTFGNMGEYYELTAMKASGISLRRIMAPLVIFIVFICFGAFFFANNVLPFTNLKMRSLLYDVRRQRPEIQIMPGSFYNGIEGYSVRVEKKNHTTNTLYDIKIYDHTLNQGNVSITIADSGKMIVTTDNRYLIFTLYHGYSYNEMEGERNNSASKTYPHRFDTFDEEEFIIELVDFNLSRTDENLFKDHQSMMNLKQLKMMEDSLEIEISGRREQVLKTLIKGNYFRKRNPRKSNHLLPGVSKDSLRLDRVKSRSGVTDKPSIFNNQQNTFTPSKKAFVKSIEPVTSSEPKNPSTSNNESVFKADTLKYFDTLYASLSIQERDRIFNEALSYARQARSYIMGSTESIDSKVSSLRRYEIEWQRKFTIAFACFVFLLIGVPLGAIIRKGGLGLPLVISTLFFIFYYIISLMGEKFVRESILRDYQGMWLPSFVFLVIGIFLTYKATTDASMLNMDTYSAFFKKILRIKKNNLIDGIAQTLSPPINDRKLKPENLVASLSSFIETMNELTAQVNTRLTPSGFMVSLIGVRESTNIILFERLYKNIARSIINSDLYDNRAIRAKLIEYPDFRHKRYLDLGWKLYFKLVLLCLPPITLLIIIRQYIQFISLKARLKTIHNLSQDMIRLVVQADNFENQPKT